MNDINVPFPVPPMRSVRSIARNGVASRLNSIYSADCMYVCVCVCICVESHGAQICARRKFCLSSSTEPRVAILRAFVKPSASSPSLSLSLFLSLSCLLSTPVQRPGGRDKGLPRRPGTCSPMFINKPRRLCPAISSELVRLETGAGDSTFGRKTARNNIREYIPSCD